MQDTFTLTRNPGEITEIYASSIHRTPINYVNFTPQHMALQTKKQVGKTLEDC